MAQNQPSRGRGGFEETDQFGNPINQTGSRQTEELGGGLGGLGTGGGQQQQHRGGAGDFETGGVLGTGQGQQQEHRGGLGSGLGTGGIGQQRGAGDMGTGGVRGTGGGQQQHQGMTDKVKDMLPGGQHGSGQTQERSTTYGTTGGGRGEQYGQEHEKKGVMEKIKEKLPGTGTGTDSGRQ